MRRLRLQQLPLSAALDRSYLDRASFDTVTSTRETRRLIGGFVKHQRGSAKTKDQGQRGPAQRFLERR